MVVASTITWATEMVRPPVLAIGVRGISSGKGRWVAPKKSWAVYSMNSETPMAVISTFSRGRLRSGR